eukprot:9448028-Ditylum_brightwellii.AAC.1
MLMLIHYPINFLIENHVYPDPSFPPDVAWSKCFKQDRLDWEEEKETYTFEITEKDVELMANEITLPSIELYLFKTYIAKNTTSRCIVKLHDDLNVSSNIGHTGVINDSNIDDINNLDVWQNTIYNVNNTTAVCPMRADLNSLATVKGLVEYYSGTLQKNNNLLPFEQKHQIGQQEK